MRDAGGETDICRAEFMFCRGAAALFPPPQPLNNIQYLFSNDTHTYTHKRTVPV